MALKYEDIKQAFIDEVNKDKTATKLYAQIRGGDATYATAGQLAQRIGADLGKVLMRNAPLENIDEWDIDDLIPKALGLDHRMITTACKQVQESMNKDAGVGIKYQEPKFNMDKAMGIVKELRDNPEYTNIEKTFYDQLENFSRSVVDDSIIANAGTLWKAGIKTVVVRIAENGCCNWCELLNGTYNYADVKDAGNDVWRRHENCNCIIDFYTEKNGKVLRERVKEGKNQTSKNDVFQANVGYEDISDTWHNHVPAGTPKVIKLSIPVDKNGNPYRDENIQLRKTKRDEKEEKRIAELIAKEIHSEVEIIPEVEKPDGRPTPDFRIMRTNETIELKTLKSYPVSKKAIYRSVQNAVNQSFFVAVDISIYPYEDLVNQQVGLIFSRDDTKFLDKLMLIRNDEIIKVYKRS